MRVAAVLVGAGRGDRLGAAVPKAFVRLAGRPLLVRAAEALAACPAVDCVQPVVPAEALARLADWAPGLAGVARCRPAVAGGAERQESVRRGLEALPAGVEWVAVHDAARPLVRPEDVARVVEAARRHGAALLATPLHDTVKRVRDGLVRETPPREECYAAQTPQVFRTEWLREGLARAAAEGRGATDDAALVEALGLPVHVVEGDPTNVKITTAVDLAWAEAWLRESAGASR
jgi:2-C-methyl-D-erythritol 4-phosphate cytidylyltransferase